jgi:hypothetical protein
VYPAIERIRKPALNILACLIPNCSYHLLLSFGEQSETIHPVKQWEIIADNLSKAGEKEIASQTLEPWASGV